MAQENPTSVRLSRELKRNLKQAAREEKRSLASAIAYILQSWLDARKAQRPDPTTALPANGQEEREL